ncbi:HNH endonuclease signature motif containing protein [Fimbriiglobus ruber]|uniref:Phage-associated homing endonuclease n=1 Tax=Fimbriiglobus ruber TaxID=1908690 RepID=A0A225E061_9BACT|nr:HNH endonuclease signature motif containing protein [Fimbriiglobus ruber]OWK42025.1 Phage-associated homing endonuclease [Fimbriiglobus ruber]
MSRHGNTEGILQFGDPLERFHQKYAVNPETGCWEWACYRHPKGYGIMGIGKYTKVRAHRFAYERLVGPIPAGMQVCHKCDQRNCVNPAHLFLGTGFDNMQDMVKKGRFTPHGRRINWANATTIRVLYCRGRHSIEDLSWIYSLDEEQVRKIVKGESWMTPPT